MRTPSRIAVFCLVTTLLVASVSAFAEQAPILPKRFASWTAASPTDAPSPLSPNVQRELGVGSAEGLAYSNGAKQILVVLQKYRDPSSAYAAYTLQLQPGMQPSDIRQYSAVASDRLLMLIGNTILEVGQAKNISSADLRLLASAVEAKADGAPLPPVRSYLPEERLAQGTQRYALGPAGFDAALAALNESKFAAITPEIGFNLGAEAMLASYGAERNNSQDLLIIDYPTPQIAEQRLHHIQAVLAGNPALAGITVERKTSLLSVVLSPASPQAAAKLREGIQYQMQVTWNEPSQTLTDPPWVSVLKNIFTGTIVFCVFALVMGVAFGGVRVVTKKFFPGKVFDRPEDMEVLQLGLSGKRIDPRDFY